MSSCFSTSNEARKRADRRFVTPSDPDGADLRANLVAVPTTVQVLGVVVIVLLLLALAWPSKPRRPSCSTCGQVLPKPTSTPLCAKPGCGKPENWEITHGILGHPFVPPSEDRR